MWLTLAIVEAEGDNLGSGSIVIAGLVGAVADPIQEVLVLAETCDIGAAAAELTSLGDHVRDTDFL